MKLSIVHKFSLSTVLVVLLTSSVIGGLFYTKISNILVENTFSAIEAEIQNTGNRLQSKIEDLYAEVLILSETPPIQGIIRAKSSNNYDAIGQSTFTQWKLRLESIFTTVINSKKSYLTLRFIDKNGQELIVVERNFETKKIAAMSDERLQSKKKRRYFIEAMKLESGAVYLSEINLNREYGKVSQPHRQVMRTSTPVYDNRTGAVAGIVLITTEIGEELQKIHNEIEKTGRNIYITNDQGGYLLHPDKSKTYGFDLGKRYRIQEDIPRLAKLFLPENKKMHHVLKPDESKSDYAIVFSKILFDPLRPERYISVTMSQAFGDIVASQSAVLNDMAIWGLILAFIATGIAILVSVRVTRPIKQMTSAVDDYSHNKSSLESLPLYLNDEVGVLARSFESMIQQVDSSQKNLRDLNDNLEAQVAERTRSLEQSEAQQRTVFKAIADAIVTIDDHGIIDGFNPAAEKIFNYTSEEVIGKNVSILLHQDERDEHEEYTKNSALNEPRIIHRTRDLKGCRKDGSSFPMELNVTPMQGDVRSGYVGVLRDITSRELAKKALLDARDEAENANHAKSQFLSSMSHELRTPLNAIIGFSQLLELNGDDLSSVQTEYVNEIQKGGEHLLALINEILDLTKIESGRIELSIEPISLEELIEEALKLITPLAEKHGLTIFIKRNDTAIAVSELLCQRSIVKGDRTRVKQVLLNLLSNAVKYNSENGSIVITYDTTDCDYTRVSIIDSGAGLTNEQQVQLFKPFNRLGAEQSEIEGTGIGLVITKNLIELMQGKIGVDSQPGIGSTFWFILPAGDSSEDHAKSKPAQYYPMLPLSNGDTKMDNDSDPGKKYNVLYIEDNPTNLRLVQLLLSHQPSIHMWSAHEPFLGLELAIEHRPDLILLDINLPGMNGFDVLRHLKQHKETRDIVVVALSANAMQKDIDRGLAAGFDDYVTKPINAKELLASISQKLGI
ncbi:MAG: PAS domain S-box protein [Gammaproteobacteria bacterium]|nr:PAS domain S-box protein [Gammaproteobacteria bacterium]